MSEFEEVPRLFFFYAASLRTIFCDALIQFR